MGSDPSPFSAAGIISFTVFLAVVTTNSPNVEGMTAIAAWMLVCIFFVFGALGKHLCSTVWNSTVLVGTVLYKCEPTVPGMKNKHLYSAVQYKYSTVYFIIIIFLAQKQILVRSDVNQKP